MMILYGDEGIIPIETLNVIRSQVLGDILKDIIPIYDSENKIIIGIKFVFEDEFKTLKEWKFGC